MIFQGGYYRDILNEYVAKKVSPCLQDVQNYEKKNHKDLSPNSGRRSQLMKHQRTSSSKFDWNSNCLIISEKTSVKGFIISSPERVRKLDM